MTLEQAYMIWKCTGRADQANVPMFREKRAGELAKDWLDRVVEKHNA